MKQLLILSGKGGTGKTTVAAAFIRLSQAHAYADCDVDAPNLHLIMGQTVAPQKTDYYGMPKAQIDAQACNACGLCMERCRFGAISLKNVYAVDPFACEGCGVCAHVCPADAVSMVPTVAGEQMLYAGGNAVFSTAQLKTGGGTSGKLVSEVKRAMLASVRSDVAIAIIDGSPGIGCPVIASMSGATMVLIVTEPSVSGLSDLKRIIRTARIFHTPLVVCINKADINPDCASQIERYCADGGIPLAGRIPFDTQAIFAINTGLTIADVDCPSGKAVRAVYDRVMQLLMDQAEI